MYIVPSGYVLAAYVLCDALVNAREGSVKAN
jgi:hypothetical protein